MKYQVLTQHFGDRQYWVGDVREIDNEQDAQALIDMGLIAPLDDGDEPKPKAKTPPKNKAEN